ncbi:MAG: hypothetical protein CMH52_06860 [Myxococcales bacterium]|nr:hypothetical protein [Myxococcales bacterium]
MFSWEHNRLVTLLIAAGLAVFGCSDELYTPDAGVNSVRSDSDYRPGKGDSTQTKPGECGPYPDYYFEYLDDINCTKRLPTNRDRNFTCPTVASSPTAYSQISGQALTYRPASDEPEVDGSALHGLVPDEMNITVILVKRINGVPHYRYLSNGTHDVIVQPWSSTKFMAIANAGAALRKASDGAIGLTATVDSFPIGDLSTIVHSYNEQLYTSNGLARWFLNIGTRSQLDHFIHDGWLKRPSEESLGGNYGHPTAAVGARFVDESVSLEMPADDGSGPENQLSTYTIAEFLKRLVMHRDDPHYAMPHLQWSDVQTLLYGSTASVLFESEQPQGMESDPSVYLQNAVDITSFESAAQGQWRIFSKLGFGYSRGGEFVSAGYGCLPVFDDQGRAELDRGTEFFIVTQLQAHRKYHETDHLIAETYRHVVHGIRSGAIQ